MTVRWVSAFQIRDLLGGSELGTPAYRQLAERLRLLAVDGRLSLGSRLPSERDLSRTLGLSRTTIVAAYAELRRAGFLESRIGSGSFVTMPHARAFSTYLPGAFSVADGQIGLSCASGSAPPGLAAAYARAAERLPSLLVGTGYLPDGLEDLRIRLAEWYAHRGLATDPDQIIVTSGALAALNVVVRALVNPGDRVVLESPTYTNALEAIRSGNARVLGYPMPVGGWEAKGFELLLRQSAPRLAYLIPEFHNPTGAWMDEVTRERLAAALNGTRTRAVADETLVELGLDTQERRTPLAALMSDAITIGSASKAFWGGLRIGWIRAPRELVRPLVEARAGLDLGTAPFEQLVLAELLADPEPVLVAQRQRLVAQRDHLVAELARLLPDWSTNSPEGGLSIWVALPDESSSRIAAMADRYGLVVTPGPRFFVDGGGERNLRLPYTSEPEVLTYAVQKLAELQGALQANPSRRTAPDGLGLSA